MFKGWFKTSSAVSMSRSSSCKISNYVREGFGSILMIPDLLLDIWYEKRGAASLKKKLDKNKKDNSV